MSTISELQTRLNELNNAFALIKDNTLKAKIQNAITDTQNQIQALQSGGGQPSTTPTPPSAPPNTSGMTPFQQAILSTLASVMKAGAGTGVDSTAVRGLIQSYLDTDKVKLSELDQSVLDEIKKHQILKLQIPNFGQTLEVSKDVAAIPNFFNIIDDVLAGNNVYLIGEAGGGKTYTAEKVSETLNRIYVTLNCSQYTSPLEILGGQSVEGFKEGKLIDCWRNGKILILDEMPKLDPNTAGLLNDALAKSSKTQVGKKINSANADEPPIPRSENFGVIATGNIYPNEPPAPQYRGNNQQDLSLLDRFSGSVYYTEFDKFTDEKMSRFKFMYDFLVGNYYEYILAKKNNQPLPTARGLRTIIEKLNFKNLSLVSYRTLTSFRVGFEYELVRAIARADDPNIPFQGKTFLNTFQSFCVAFKGSPDSINSLITETGYTDDYVKDLAERSIQEIISSPDGWINSLNDSIKDVASKNFARYQDFYALQTKVQNPTP